MGKPVELEAWERQPKESSVAFAAFVIYRDLGPAKRSLAKVSKTVGKSTVLMARWSRKYGWVERARLWDVDQDRERRARWSLERFKMDERHVALAKSMQGMVARSLRDWQEKGKRLQPKQVAKWMATAAQLERLAMGLPTTRQAVQDEEPAPAKNRELDYSRLTEDELKTLDALLAKAAGEGET